MRVGLTLLTDATEMLLRGVRGTVVDDHEAGEKRVTITTTVPELLKAVEQAALHVHAYYPEQGEPALSRRRLERATEPIAVLRRRVAAAGTAKRFAADHGVSGQHVGDVLRGNRSPGSKLLAILGLTRVTTYTETPPCSTP